MTTFDVSQSVKNPDIVEPSESLGRKEYNKVTMRGEFYRVFPRNGKQHSAIMMLKLHEERFAPWHGDGVLITANAYRKFQAE